MRKIMQFATMFLSLALLTGCPKIPNGEKCNQYLECASGLPCGADGNCVGRAPGADCTASEQCADNGMCVVTGGAATGKCQAQTCNPPCRGLMLCSPQPLEPNLCIPAEPLLNGAPCSDRLQCASLLCVKTPGNVTGWCMGVPDGGYCGAMDTRCSNRSCSHTTGLCIPTTTCNPACQPGQDCVNSVCYERTDLAIGMPCHLASNCATNTCTANKCAASSGCTPVCPADGSGVTCGQSIPNSCGGFCAITGTQCPAGQTCGGGTCNTTPNFTVSVTSSITVNQGGSGSVNVSVTSTDNTSKTVNLTVTGAPTGMTVTLNPTSGSVSSATSLSSTLSISASASVPVGTYTLTVTGTIGNDNRTDTVIVTVTASGGSGLPNGSTCSANTDCGSGHCGPAVATTKMCLGKVDHKGTAAAATECWSGALIATTNTCGPAQYKACATSSAFTQFQMWNSSGAATRLVQVAGAGRCILSDPTKDETSATESADFNCYQYTDWTVSTGKVCNSLTGNVKQAVWNTDRNYNLPLGASALTALMKATGNLALIPVEGVDVGFVQKYDSQAFFNLYGVLPPAENTAQ